MSHRVFAHMIKLGPPRARLGVIYHIKSDSNPLAPIPYRLSDFPYHSLQHYYAAEIDAMPIDLIPCSVVEIHVETDKIQEENITPKIGGPQILLAR